MGQILKQNNFQRSQLTHTLGSLVGLLRMSSPPTWAPPSPSCSRTSMLLGWVSLEPGHLTCIWLWDLCQATSQPEPQSPHI